STVRSTKSDAATEYLSRSRSPAWPTHARPESRALDADVRTDCRDAAPDTRRGRRVQRAGGCLHLAARVALGGHGAVRWRPRPHGGVLLPVGAGLEPRPPAPSLRRLLGRPDLLPSAIYVRAVRADAVAGDRRGVRDLRRRLAGGGLQLGAPRVSGGHR